jgi:hypothetical protein
MMVNRSIEWALCLYAMQKEPRRNAFGRVPGIRWSTQWYWAEHRVTRKRYHPDTVRTVLIGMLG